MAAGSSGVAVGGSPGMFQIEIGIVSCVVEEETVWVADKEVVQAAIPPMRGKKATNNLK
jgi:hypothetical protein